MGSGPGSHPASLQSYGSGQGLPFGLMAIFSGHVGDLQTIPYCVKDAQVTAMYLNGADRALKGGLLQGLYCCCSDSVVCGQSFGHASGPGHP